MHVSSCVFLGNKIGSAASLSLTTVNRYLWSTEAIAFNSSCVLPRLVSNLIECLCPYQLLTTSFFVLINLQDRNDGNGNGNAMAASEVARPRPEAKMKTIQRL